MAGDDPDGYTDRFANWHASHKPFHWYSEFYGIMQRGGFDAIIGNPPYVEYTEVKKKDKYTVRDYSTESCGNLYAFMTERSLSLSTVGKIGLIIPVASVCTDGYIPLQTKLRAAGDLVISYFNDRPSKLFDGLEHIRLVILLIDKAERIQHAIHTTKYNAWTTTERTSLFDRLEYIESSRFAVEGIIPKFHRSLESVLISKMNEQQPLERFESRTGTQVVYYSRKLSGFVQVTNFVPTVLDHLGNRREPSEFKSLSFVTRQVADVFLALLNSSLFYWHIMTRSDCRHLNKREVFSAMLDYDNVSDQLVEDLANLANNLMRDVQNHSKMLMMKYEKFGQLTIQCIYPKYSKPIIDEIDRVLAQHYGFTDEELDFIINYDIKYRMGQGAAEDAE